MPAPPVGLLGKRNVLDTDLHYPQMTWMAAPPENFIPSRESEDTSVEICTPSYPIPLFQAGVALICTILIAIMTVGG